MLDNQAELYGVKTKEVNQAVKNFDHLIRVKYSNALPTAFTEKGLYMLAAILKSPKATETTIAIVETFAKIRELSSLVNELPDIHEKDEQKSLMQRGSELFSEVMNDGALEIARDETTVEL